MITRAVIRSSLTRMVEFLLKIDGSEHLQDKEISDLLCRIANTTDVLKIQAKRGSDDNQ